MGARQSSRNIACVYVPRIEVQTVLRERFGDGGAEEAVAIVRGPPERLVVQSCSLLAEECGVRPGLNLAAARGACPDLLVVSHDPERGLETLGALAEALGIFGPLVSLAGPNAVLIDVSGVDKAVHAETGATLAISADSLLRTAAELGLRARAAIGSTPFAARALARLTGSSFAASEPGGVSSGGVSSGGVSSGGVSSSGVVSSGAVEARAVGRLPLIAARLPKTARDALQVVGIRTIGAFMALPVESLTRRFGPEVRGLWREAHGLEVPELVPYQPSRPIAEHARLDEPVEQIEVLCFRLKTLLDRAIRRLRGRCEGVETLQLTLSVEPHFDAALDPDFTLHRSGRGSGGGNGGGYVAMDGEGGDADLFKAVLALQPARRARKHELRIELGHPSQDGGFLLQLVRDRLSSCPPPGPVSQVSLEVLRATSLEPVQLELFGERPPPETMSATVARLAAIMGQSHFTPVLREDYRPDRAWELGEFRAARRPRRSESRAAPPPGPRPSRLLRQPEPIGALDGSDRPPPGAVNGPERLVSGWWDGDPIARDYWVLADRYGRRTWVFRELANNRWFLHGYFD